MVVAAKYSGPKIKSISLGLAIIPKMVMGRASRKISCNDFDKTFVKSSLLVLAKRAKLGKVAVVIKVGMA